MRTISRQFVSKTKTRLLQKLNFLFNFIFFSCWSVVYTLYVDVWQHSRWLLLWSKTSSDVYTQKVSPPTGIHFYLWLFRQLFGKLLIDWSLLILMFSSQSRHLLLRLRTWLSRTATQWLHHLLIVCTGCHQTAPDIGFLSRSLTRRPVVTAKWTDQFLNKHF